MSEIISLLPSIEVNGLPRFGPELISNDDYILTLNTFGDVGLTKRVHLVQNIEHTHIPLEVGLGNVLNETQITVSNVEMFLSGDSTKIPTSYAIKNYVDSHLISHIHTPYQVGLGNVTNERQLTTNQLTQIVTDNNTLVPSSKAVYDFFNSKIEFILTTSNNIPTSQSVIDYIDQALSTFNNSNIIEDGCQLEINGIYCEEFIFEGGFI